MNERDKLEVKLIAAGIAAGFAIGVYILLKTITYTV